MATAPMDDNLPAGIRHRATLSGHQDAIVRVLWSPSGDQLISASIDNTIRLWDLETTHEYHQVVGHRRGFTACVLTPNGRYALTANWNDYDIEIWDLVQQQCVVNLTGHQGAVNSIQCTPDGWQIISGSDDHTLMVWNLESGAMQRVLKGHAAPILCTALSNDGRFIISGDADGQIKLWDLSSGAHLMDMRGHAGVVNALSLGPGNHTLASGSEDGTIRLWDLQTGRPTSVLGGHTAPVLSVTFSADGRLLASKSADQTMRIWRADTWESIASLPEVSARTRGYTPQALAFHPQRPLLASLGHHDTAIRVWELDYSQLLDQGPPRSGYMSRKIALIGDTGIGKSRLGYRLIRGQSSNAFNTNHHRTWVLNGLSQQLEDGTVCEAVLWDFERQTDHRLVHAPLLRDIDVALLVFDTSNWENPLAGVEYWLRHLALGGNDRARLVLVGTRSDTGAMMLKPHELHNFCQHHGIGGGYVITSAQEDQGIDNLLRVIDAQLDWTDRAQIIAPETLHALRETLDALAGPLDQPRVVLPLAEIDAYLDNLPDAYPDERLAGLRHLETLGHVWLLADAEPEPLVILKPDVLLDLMSAILAEARRTTLGLGTLEAARLADSDYDFAPLHGIFPAERHALLVAALTQLETHQFFFRETFDGVTLLIFPQLINRKRPFTHPNDVQDDMSYRITITGPRTQTYAALVVFLNQNRLYTRTYQWDYQAQFEMSPGEICGFRLFEIDADMVEIVLYYGLQTPVYTRNIFHGLVEKFLATRSTNIQRFPALDCPNCGHRQDRHDVVTMIEKGRDHMFCVMCGHRIPLGGAAPYAHPGPLPARAQALPPTPPRGLEQTSRPEAQSSLTEFQRFLGTLRDTLRKHHADRFGVPTCFISHAWGNPNHEQWVARLAGYLHEAGVRATVDNWDNPYVGQLSTIVAQMQSADFILVIGTPDYARKYEQMDMTTGNFVVEEIEHLNARLYAEESTAGTVVLPILLDGDPRAVFPGPLQNIVPIRMNEARFYFIGMLNLVLRLYRIAPTDPIMGEIRAHIQNQNRSDDTP